ncbi:PAS domain S-box protein [Breoghania sp. L-A4]|uniref:PAS domain S-box protein n=1 Tax=Breoghania sp. L-A4 TaxID=2304600 RepID=UPI000E35B4C3|nr:PAS domain S-box protein [Breoghania sp. L-A4]AXS42008.1 PAS domain S-box protein [Breoghania sp. L-A4]
MNQAGGRRWHANITSKFLLILLPIVLLATLATVSVFGWLTVEKLRADLTLRGDRLTRFYATALSSPLWNYDLESVERTLRTLTLDPDVGQAVLSNMNGETLAQVGDSDLGAEQILFHATRPVEYKNNGATETIGTLTVRFSNLKIQSVLETEILIEFVLVLVLVGCLSLGSLITFRFIIFRPLTHLLLAIRSSRGLDALTPVTWSARDEIGEVIQAYETMRRTIVREEQARFSAQAAVVRSEKHFRDLIEGSIQGVLIHRDFRPLYVNQAWCDMFGYTGPAEILALESIHSMIATEDRQRLQTLYDQEIARERPLPIFEFKGIRRDGSEVWLQNANRRIEWEGAPAVQAVAIDISEQKLAQEQLLQAQKMEATGQLTGGIAHDFNNLLAIIQGNIELLCEDVGDDNALAQAIQRAARRGAELTQRLLAFSRRQSLHPQAVNLAHLADGLLDLLQRSLGETISIKVMSEDALWTAKADPGQVENTLLNLAINSRDAMPTGGLLTIACRNLHLDTDNAPQHPNMPAGDYAVLSVSDTGNGMPPYVMEHAMEPFFTTKSVGEGSGLGLSMVYGFANQSGGGMTIESALGVGTTVSIYLPRAEAAAVPAAALGTMHREIGRNEHILLIEDDPDVRTMVRVMLERLHYRVISVGDVAEAGRVLSRGSQIDLVLSDVMLPGGVSGAAFAADLAHSHPELKVVLMSGYSAEHINLEIAPLTKMTLLNKPFSLDHLSRSLRLALD